MELEDSGFDSGFFDSDFFDSDLLLLEEELDFLLLEEEEEETEDMGHLLMGAEDRRTVPTRSTFRARYDMSSRWPYFYDM